MMCVILDWIVTGDRHQEIAGNQPFALMYQLIKSVLAVGARFAPHNWTSFVGHDVSGAVHVLTVGLHVPLLEVGGEAV